jgi:uncharacterized protein (DUF2336 family)
MMDADEATRVRQGASEATSQDILRELATDPSVTVRASLALNPALPADVVAMLASDTDARVRTILSRKLTALTPTLNTEVRERVQGNAVASLTSLVAEAALRVRANVAETVRDMADGPRDIILRLAQDPAVMVCEPVILFSPLLTQEDLVALIASSPPSTTVMAVASRPGIGTSVCDAIVGSAEPQAIRALLCNRTAQIREATLDALAAQSEEHTDWQEPLIRRPQLSARAQRMLSEIVTGHLLGVLSARSDLDPKVGQALRTALTIKNQAVEPAAQRRSDLSAQSDVDSVSALHQAETLHKTGRLDDYAILDAVRTNRLVTAKAMLAIKANVGVPAVERACTLRSARAIISLAWQAGLSAQTAVVLQSMLANLAPDKILRPDNNTYPLSDGEMRWQLAFLGDGQDDPKPRPWMPRRL